MDVTALLNSTSAAAGQRKSRDVSCTPTRSRTPWDAGGYSLPISTHSNAAFTPPQQIHYDDPPSESPTSSKHRLSDSRSSLSSFTSSLNSTTHSRFSSMSTVGSSHPLNNLITDNLYIETRRTPQPLKASGYQPPPESGSATETQQVIIPDRKSVV